MTLSPSSSPTLGKPWNDCRMPPFFHLRRSTAHRVACIALYRALLVQWPRIYLPDERLRGPINPILHLVRKRFHKQQHQQSPRLVVAALKLGYEAEELLRSAGDGDEAATKKVMSILRAHQERGDATRERQAMNPPPPPKALHRKPGPFPDAKKMLETRPRPLSELSGKRHVPKLQNTNGIPFLLYMKPQSPYLSRVLKNAVKKIAKTRFQIDDLESFGLGAEYEDSWDAIVKDKVVGESWSESVDMWEDSLWAQTKTKRDKNSDMARKMVEIVDQERALANEERNERKAKGKQRRMAKLSL